MQIAAVEKTSIEIVALEPVDDTNQKRLISMLNTALDDGVNNATEAAINAGCRAIQNALGVTSGDYAGIYFSDNSRLAELNNVIAGLMADYAVAELENILSYSDSSTITTPELFILYDFSRTLQSASPDTDELDGRIFWSRNGWAGQAGAGVYLKNQALNVKAHMEEIATLQLIGASTLEEMRLFVVSLIENEEESEDHFTFFPCFAKDIQHAMDQAASAYPYGSQFGEMEIRH
jgi:hypothetical protein